MSIEQEHFQNNLGLVAIAGFLVALLSGAVCRAAERFKLKRLEIVMAWLYLLGICVCGGFFLIALAVAAFRAPKVALVVGAGFVVIAVIVYWCEAVQSGGGAVGRRMFGELWPARTSNGSDEADLAEIRARTTLLGKTVFWPLAALIGAAIVWTVGKWVFGTVVPWAFKVVFGEL